MDETLKNQTERFCSLADPGEWIVFATSMAEEHSHDSELKEAWRYVVEIARYPVAVEFKLLEDKSKISFLDKALGPDVALKLYRYYIERLSGGPPRNPTVPMFILPDEEFVSMMRRSNLSDNELVALHKLQRETKEAKAQLDRREKQE
jgi:hypothetical protein